MTRSMRRLFVAQGVLATLLSSLEAWGTPWAVDFEELPAGSGGIYNGSDLAGGFESRLVHFNNSFTDFGNGCC